MEMGKLIGNRKMAKIARYWGGGGRAEGSEVGRGGEPGECAGRQGTVALRCKGSFGAPASQRTNS